MSQFSSIGVEQINLQRFSSWQIGGIARIAEPGTPGEVAEFVRAARNAAIPWIAVGETTNLLFDSRGFEGVLVRVGTRMSEVQIEGNRVIAGAGVRVPELVQRLTRAGLAGIEHAAGIPGTLGGLVLMNGGTRRRGVLEVVEKIRVVEESGKLSEISARDLESGYRYTSLQISRSVIVDVELNLREADAESLNEEVEASILDRSRKFPLDLPSCGSTFLSDPRLYEAIGPPGRAIELAGLKGLRSGDAEISSRHANFIVNHGSATDSDVLWLIAQARRSVFEETGFLLACEVRHVDPWGVVRPAHRVAAERWPEVDPEGHR